MLSPTSGSKPSRRQSSRSQRQRSSPAERDSGADLREEALQHRVDLIRGRQHRVVAGPDGLLNHRVRSQLNQALEVGGRLRVDIEKRTSDGRDVLRVVRCEEAAEEAASEV